VIRDDTGLAVDYVIEGPGANSVPQYGNNDDRVDSIAADLVTRFMQKIRKHPTYRNATHTQSVLTITSNVVYGKATGNTPDGPPQGRAVRPGANPMHGRDSHGWLASCLSVAKLPYKDSLDGISYTVSVAPQKAHLSDDELIDGAVKAFDTYFEHGRLPHEPERDRQGDARGRDEESGQVSAAHDPGVRAMRSTSSALTREQQLDVISRTFHGRSEAWARAQSQLGSSSRQPHDLPRSFAGRADEGEFRDDGKALRLRPLLRDVLALRRPRLRTVLFVSAAASLLLLPQPRYWHLKDGTYVSASR
jgi:formate C-acetyltransferase